MSYTVVQGKLRHLRGWKPDRPDHRDRALPLLMAVKLPAAVDLRQQGTLTPVDDQGAIGSCVGHGVTEACESLQLIRKQPRVDLSRLFVYFATRVWVEGEDPHQDGGCMIRDAMKALRLFGVCKEELWPYIPANYATAPPKACVTEALSHAIIAYFRCPNLAAIKLSLAQGYPVVIGFSVPTSMMTSEVDRTGVVPYPASDEGFVGGHCVLLCGYDDAKNLLTFQNSWGEGWGDKGFGYLPYKYVETWLADDFWTVRMATGV